MHEIRTALAESEIDRLEAALLMAHVIERSHEFILAHPEHVLSQSQFDQFRNLCRERAKGKPLALIFGEKEFYGRMFLVNEHTLIPRPETELLVEKALRTILRNNPSHTNISVIDVGTGSGCIAISITKQLKNVKYQMLNVKCCAIDISKNALEVAKRNAKKHNVHKNISFIRSYLLEYFLSSSAPCTIPTSSYSLSPTHYSLTIIANLPYVPSSYLQKKETNLTRGLAYEPKSALDGGEDGLDLYRKLLDQTRELSEKNPEMRITSLYEIDDAQKNPIQKEILSRFPNVNISFSRDLSGHWRVVSFSLREK